jgi:DNA-3-methyladenine glycosylase II
MHTNIRPEIISHLKKDKILAILIDNCTINIEKKPIKVFDDLIRSIVSQQLSTSAAATIYGRFINSFHNETPIAKQIQNRDVEDFRQYGLSYQKAGYIKNVVQHFEDNNLFDTDWDQWTDEDIITELTKIKGVGKWTVEMILMFSLFREDVLPLDDLIIRNQMVRLYKVTSEKKQLVADLNAVAASWRPYRTYACRYLWAAKDSKFVN